MNHKLVYGASLGLVVGIVSMLFSAQKIEFSDASLKKLAKDAYVWAYPLVVMERSKQLFTQEGKTSVNRFRRFENIVTPSFTEVVTPNVDTLYSIAWLDLEKEPLVLSVPNTDDRYYVIQFVDAYTNVFKNIGKRTTGTKQGTYLIVGPDWQGKTPEGMTRIASPTNLAWLITRVLVNGREEVAQVRGILSKITLAPLSGKCVSQFSTKPAGTPQEVNKAGITFFDELGKALINNPPPAAQKGFVELFKLVGVGPGKMPSKELQDEKLKAILSQAVIEGEKEIDEKIATFSTQVKNGWYYDLKTGIYGDDYLFRAAIAKQGFGANVAQESLYPMAYVDATGKTLSGVHSYTIHFDKLPPVDAFWSLTIYDVKTRGLVPNTLKRYALSDRSKMSFNKDGSLDIVVQRTKPEKESNWLPAPQGEFYLVLRQYMPQKAILDDTYEYPLIKRAE